MPRLLLCFLLPLSSVAPLAASPEAARPQEPAPKSLPSAPEPSSENAPASPSASAESEPVSAPAESTAKSQPPLAPAAPPPPNESTPHPPAASTETDDEDDEEEMVGDLFSLGQQLFETFAPEEIKERYRFPTREDWDEFAGRLERALQSNSFGALAEMEEDARAALVALRALPDYADYADWLEERLDDIGVAQQLESASRDAVAATPPKAPDDPIEPAKPETSPENPKTPSIAAAVVPLYDVWLERMRRRPPPVRAAGLVPRLKPVFHQAEVPAALVWLAETESSFNPAARSPVGARGLFQLMPGTAKDLGLRLFPFDERLDPLKSAQSAARYLNRLHRRFEDWPLALAAYNAGPNRVSRLLKEHQAKTFAEIADALPAETRLYVPKVLATVAVREGVTLEALAAGSAPTVAAHH